jgi:ketosteroid isomerase-like protein
MALNRNFMLTFFLCITLASPCLAKQKGANVNADVKMLVELHNKAFNAQDLKGIMGTYASVPEIVLMGTGPGESYRGEEAIGSAYNQFFTKFDANTLNFKYDWIAVGSRGEMAWFAVTTHMESILKTEKKEREINMSGTLMKVKGKWRIVSMHFSRLGVEESHPEQSG